MSEISELKKKIPNELEDTLASQFANSMTAVATMILLYGFVFEISPNGYNNYKIRLVQLTGCIAVAFSVNALWMYAVRALHFIHNDATTNKTSEHVHVYLVIAIGVAFTLLQAWIIFVVLRQLNLNIQRKVVR